MPPTVLVLLFWTSTWNLTLWVETFVTSKIYPDWKGNLLVGSLSFQYLERVVLKNEKVIKREKLLENIGRVRNVKQRSDGYIFFSVEEPGRIYKILPN